MRSRIVIMEYDVLIWQARISVAALGSGWQHQELRGAGGRNAG